MTLMKFFPMATAKKIENYVVIITYRQVSVKNTPEG